jgi:2-iminobutanoate/2-iminopropanoate deaminase
MVMTSEDPVIRIRTDGAPQPAGHYSQAIVAGGCIYVAGQLPIRPDGAALIDQSFDDQARQAIANMLAILAAAGGDARHLLKVTAYIVGVDNWPRFNAVYASMLPDARPARTVVPVTELHHGYLVEVDAIGLLTAAARSST